MIQLLLKLEDRNIFSFFSPGVRSSIQKKKEKKKKEKKNIQRRCRSRMKLRETSIGIQVI